jgi:hypothetical protein
MPRHLRRLLVAIEQDVGVFVQQAAPCSVGELARVPTNMTRIWPMIQGARAPGGFGAWIVYTWIYENLAKVGPPDRKKTIRQAPFRIHGLAFRQQYSVV